MSAQEPLDENRPTTGGEVTVKAPMNTFIKGGFGFGCGCLLFAVFVVFGMPVACTGLLTGSGWLASRTSPHPTPPSSPPSGIKPGAMPGGESTRANDVILTSGQVGKWEHVLVRPTRWGVGKIQLWDSIGRRSSVSADDAFWVQVQIYNSSSDKKVDYATWRGTSYDRNAANLTDASGNIYKRCDYGPFTKPVGSSEEDAAIYPGQSIADILVFERPVGSSVILALTGEKMGFRGTIKYTIP